MTVPRERTNAVIFTETFLLSLMNPKETPRVPKAVRKRAGELLRHYPSKYEMEVIASREDQGGRSPLHIKIFGMGWE